MKVEKQKIRSDTATPEKDYFPKGGGEMGELIRSIDWSKTSVGPIESWPQSLKGTVSMLLNSKFGMFLWWGPDLIQFYNDAYRPSFGKSGEKHPKAMGQKGKDCWGEIWHIIYPQIEQVLSTGKPTWNDNQLVPIYRNDILEEVYWTYSYSPVFEESGKVGGVLVVETETTKQVIGERRTALLRDLAVSLNTCSDVEAVCKSSIEVFSKDNYDIPFSLIYTFSEDKEKLNLASSTGLTNHPKARPVVIAKKDTAWSAWDPIVLGYPIHLDDQKELGDLPGGFWDENTKEACVIPLIPPNQHNPVGVIIIGISPRIPFDNEYRNFLESLGRQISSGIATAIAFQEEKKRAESLAEIDKAKTVFFSNVSHEFRTPLTLMISPLKDLISRSLAPEIGDDLQMVYDNSLRLQKLVNTLLDFSSIEAGRIRANYIPTDIASFTAELSSNFRSAIERAGMQLVIKISKIKDPVFIDREMWEKIILNLLSNAFKFTFEGKIEVSVHDNENNVVVEIRDTGIGIPDKDITNIFERFKRIEGVKARSHEGSGIGLSLVQELVKLHNGTIDVKSQVGTGTTFTITIPKGYDHLPKTQIRKSSYIQSSSVDINAYKNEVEQWSKDDLFNISLDGMKDSGEEKPYIIVVDDNSDMRRYIKKLFSGRFEVLVASNGKKALELLNKRIPELIISDIMMPEMNGFELFTSLKTNPATADIPVVIVSARTGEEAKLESLKIGIDHYLEKPFNANELIARVNSIIAAKRAKRETESQIYNYFMDAPAFIALLKGPDHVFELCNERYRKLVGKDRDIIGKPVLKALPEVKNQGFIELLDNVYNSGKPFVGNELLAQLDKNETGELERVYLNFVYHPQKDSKGNTCGIFVHGIDVSDQVSARKKIEQAEAKLSAIVNQVTAGIVQTDIKGNFILSNERFREITGYSKKDLLSKKREDIIHEDDLNNYKGLVEKLLKHRKNFKAEYRIKNNNGSVTWVNDNTSLVEDANGNPNSVITVAVDITEKKKTEESLRESEKNFRTLADNIPNLCWMANKEGWIYWFNSRWYEYTGTTPEEMIGWGWKKVHDPNILPEVLKKFKLSIKTGEVFEMDFPLRGADGNYRPFLTRMTPVKDDEGNVLQWFGTNTDITEREKLAKQKDDFLGIASHELKTPVTSIKAYTQVLLDRFEKAEDVQTAKMLSKMDGQLNKLTSLISDLLDVTKIEQGKLKFRKEPFNFNELVLETVEEVQRMTSKHTFKVELKDPKIIMADRDRIGQVITNFLTNAIKYSPKKEQVLIKTDFNQEELILSVRDFGIGLTKEDCYKVFERFYRVGGSGYETYPGLGLGLFISSEIIQRHYGEIWAEREEDGGSTFYFTLPLKSTKIP